MESLAPRFLCVLALGIATAAAQAPRRALVGTVVDGDGTPLAAAQVTLVHTDPGRADTSASDVVTCTSDARGRFIAKVLPVGTYSAWACVEAAGALRTSGVCDTAIPGGDCRLVVDRAVDRCEVDVRDLEAWAAFGPFEVLVAPRAANVAFVPLAEASRLPAIAHVLVRDATQRVLVHEEMHGGPIGGRFVVHVPPPRTTRLAVRHFDGGPAAGAQVLAATARAGIEAIHTAAPFGRPRAMFWREVGTTSADGTVTVTAPQGAGAWPLLVRTPDSAESMIVRASQDDAARIDGGPTTRSLDGTFAVQLRPAMLLSFAYGDKPLARGEVFVAACIGGFTVCDRSFARALGPAGTYELPLGDGVPIGALLSVRDDDAAPWHVHRLFPDPGNWRRIDLAADREFALQVRLPNGDPARGFAGIVKPADDAIGEPVHVATDQGGRLTCHLGPGAWIVFLTDGTHYAHAALAENAPGKRVQCTAKPFEQREFAVQDVSGHPVEGAVVGQLRIRRKHGLPTTDDDAGMFRILSDLLPRLHEGARSGPDGKLVLPVVGTLVDGLRIAIQDPRTGWAGVAGIRPDGATPVVLGESRASEGDK